MMCCMFILAVLFIDALEVNGAPPENFQVAFLFIIYGSWLAV